MTNDERTESENNWDPAIPGQRVRLRDNPGRQGETTGKTKQAGSFLLAEVYFGPNEKQFKRADLLELVEITEDMFDLLRAGRFGGPIDLRRVLTFEKVKGDLTNVFYSMEASNTDFYPHQFKPVLKFIESPVGRLLIADEVGLGKTIESTYIWKELQARQDARRLLVVCPAMLREKWKNDLKKHFNIVGELVSARDLVEKLTDFVQRGFNNSFVYIVSLESLRPPKVFENSNNMSARAQLARLLDQNISSEEFSLFDLVIMDEAHYLRNPKTSSNRLGCLLRESARHLVLLTATPIQIASDNLYQLLKLIDPDQFYNSELFDEMLNANIPIVRALRALWRVPVNVEGTAEALDEALANSYFADDAVLKRIREQLPIVTSDTSQRIELVRMLETRSLLGQYMTRNRKREVLERKVERVAQVLNINFSEIERSIYTKVTERIRQDSVGKSGVSLFALIARQRQMASSLVAALESWREKGLLEELLWEDLGLSLELTGQKSTETEAAETLLEHEYGTQGSAENDGLGISEIDFQALELADGKYNALRDVLRLQLQKNPEEKFVVFAFFRGTLRYLERRLKKDGIRTALIMGGMGDTKDEILREFATTDGSSVLLSSEVGSEGIDLQFCRFVVNYDLPWNPMRVEQRIGRLDRLGQKAERISIINLVLQDTIEDRILMRLYHRIEIFKDSIGDLEVILGEISEELMLTLLDPNLSDEERDRRALASEMAILNRRAIQERLEQEAVNLVGFSDYILDHIKESRQKGRWLSGQELIDLVDDFFARKYPGTKIEADSKIELAVRLRLSDEAKTSLGAFIAETKPATRTRLHQSSAPALCLFDPKRFDGFGQSVELIEPTHPLIQWIRCDYTKDNRQLHPVSAIKLDEVSAGVPLGDYVFVTHRWSFAGLRSEQYLAFRAKKVGQNEILNPTRSEDLVSVAARLGKAFSNATNLAGTPSVITKNVQACEVALTNEFGQQLLDCSAENELRCSQQETSARKFADRRIGELKGRLQRFRYEGELRLLPMTEGLLRKEETQLKIKLERIAQRRMVDPTMIQIATGFIRVE